MTWGPFSLEAPLALGLLLLLPLLPRAQHRGWRLLAVSLLALALAQPTLQGGDTRITLLLDVSESVVSTASDAALTLLAQHPGADVVLFAGDATRVMGPGPWPLPAGLQTERTNLARALAVASTLNPGRILLVSDGIDATWDARSDALPRGLDGSFIPVDVYPVAARPNARLEGLWAPERVSAGSAIEITAVVTLDRAANARLRVSLDGAPLSPIDAPLPAGRHALPLQVQLPDAAAGGVVRVTARLEVDFDQPLQDDAQSLELTITPTLPVWVVGDRALAEVLRVQGIEVLERAPSDVRAPLDASALVVRAGAAAFTPGQLELMARYVEQGGGLLFTGGPEGFGLGGWYRTPVENVLPVSSEVRGDLSAPRVAIVMVLDISQSMAVGSPSRLELAKQGVVDVIDLAYEEDLLGLVVFSDPSLTRWVFELRPATEAGRRAMLANTLALAPQGGTILRPGYTMALDALRRSDAAVRHVIVLSDGKLFDGQGLVNDGAAPDWAALASAARAEGITTSGVAIGADADVDALRALALGGGGRFVEAFDVGTLPRLFSAEAMLVSRDVLRREPITPQALRHPLSPWEGASAPLEAYIATTLRPGSEVLLMGADAEPVLAITRAGLGRSAAFTTDLNGWAGALAQWPPLPAVLSGVVRWLQTRPARFSVSAERQGGALRVVVDAVEAGQFVDDRPLLARFQGVEAPLVQTGPGQYQAELLTAEASGTLVVVDAGEVVARQTIATPDPEFDAGDGHARLRLIADRTGGERVVDLAAYQPTPSAAPRPLWAWPALAAFAVLLIELYRRRFAPERA